MLLKDQTTLLAAFATEVEARADSPYEQPSFPFCSETLPNVAPGSKSFLPWMRDGSTGPTFPTACALEFVTASTDIIGAHIMHVSCLHAATREQKSNKQIHQCSRRP
jgi:hypothetical protein